MYHRIAAFSLMLMLTAALSACQDDSSSQGASGTTDSMMKEGSDATEQAEGAMSDVADDAKQMVDEAEKTAEEAAKAAEEQAKKAEEAVSGDG